MPIVVQEGDAVRREGMLKKISKRVDIRLGALQQQLDDELADKKQQNHRNAMREVDRLRTKLETAKVEEIPGILRDSATSVEATQSTKFSQAAHGVQDTVSFIQDLKREFEQRGKGLPGWLTGFREIDEAIGGMPREECMITVAGDGNVGKSCIVQNFGLRVAMNNPDAAVLLYTIDDTRKQTIPRLVSQLTGIPINVISQPMRYQISEEDQERIAHAWNSLRTLTHEGRFDLKDASQGQDVEFARQWIEHTQANQPDKSILFILDNFHRLRVGRQGPGTSDDRARLEAASDAIFNFTKQLGISALCTMELRKRENISKRPRIEDLKGSKRFEYDNSVIAMVHCQMHANPESNDVECWEEEQVRKPILQMWFDKNKVTSFKGMVKMKLRPECAQILDQDDETQSLDVPVLPDE
jgi:replicative DNA helicase